MKTLERDPLVRPTLILVLTLVGSVAGLWFLERSAPKHEKSVIASEVQTQRFHEALGRAAIHADDAINLLRTGERPSDAEFEELISSLEEAKTASERWRDAEHQR